MSTPAAAPAGDLPKLRVVVCGGGPVGLVFAIRLAEYMKDSVRIRVFEGRFKPAGTRMAWRELADGNRRRPQVVTVQDDVSGLLSKRTFEKFFEQQNERVWPTSRNIAIREVEDRMLERAQEDDIKNFIELVPENLDEAKVKGMNGTFDVLVGADGGRSWVRTFLAVDFQPQQVGSDFGLGIAYTLPTGVQPQPQSLNILLTVSQTRYLLNSREGRTGFLNMRLDQHEWDQMVDISGQQCPWHRPGMVKKSNGEMDGTPDMQFKPQADNSPAWLSILEGLKLFKLPLDHVQGIIRIPIDVIYSGHFVAEMRGYVNTHRQNPPIAFVVGDAAFRVHFWPGRGLNSGIKGAVSLARGMYWAYNSPTNRGVLRQQDFWRYEAFMQGLRYREEEGRSMPVVEMRKAGEIVTIGQRIKQARDAWWNGKNCYDEYLKTLDSLKVSLERIPTWVQPPLTIDIKKYIESCELDPLTYNILVYSDTWPRSAMAGEEISPSILFSNPDGKKSFFPVEKALKDDKLGAAVKTALKSGEVTEKQVAEEIAAGETQAPAVYPDPGAVKALPSAGTRGPSLPTKTDKAPAPAPAAQPQPTKSPSAPPAATPAAPPVVLAQARPQVVGGRVDAHTAYKQNLPVPQPDGRTKTPSPEPGTRQKIKEKVSEKMDKVKSHLGRDEKK